MLNNRNPSIFFQLLITRTPVSSPKNCIPFSSPNNRTPFSSPKNRTPFSSPKNRTPFSLQASFVVFGFSIV